MSAMSNERKEYLFRLGKAVADCIHQRMGSPLRPSQEHLRFASRQLDLHLCEIKKALDYFNYGHYEQ